MRAVVVVASLALAAGCVSTERVPVRAEEVAGMFAATADLHAESRIHLKGDRTYEMYTLLWHRLRSTPAGEVPDSIGYETGRWTLERHSVLLTSSGGKSLSLRFERDAGTLFLIRGKFRFRMLYPEGPNKAPEPTPTAVTPRAIE